MGFRGIASDPCPLTFHPEHHSRLLSHVGLGLGPIIGMVAILVATLVQAAKCRVKICWVANKLSVWLFLEVRFDALIIVEWFRESH